MKMDLGKSEDAGIYEGGDGFGAEKSRARPNRLLLQARLLPTQDPSVPSPVGDEAVQRSRGRLFRIGARDRAVASRRDDAPVSLSAELGGFLKKVHHRDEKKTPVVRALIKQ